ncbi:MAG: FAD-dependent oxidoreductase, partial [Defluviitaleaceae bacterium]|nr:FAD-dependent oxidoreductase [Defluviitaleaceae bacterium]
AGDYPKQPFTLETSNNTFTADIVINAAGIESDTIHNHVADSSVLDVEAEAILPQRGQYYMLDIAYKGFVNNTLFPLPGPQGKGILIAPTVDGNTIVGPNAEDLSPENKNSFNDRNDTQTTRAGLDDVSEKAKQTVPDLPMYGSITTFAGIRAKHQSKDFVINEPVSGFINALGIDSPGLSAAPAIGETLAQMAAAKLNSSLDPNHNPRRKATKRFSLLTFEEQAALIKENPKYGHVVCRCEMVTEAEIIDAIRRPVGARNLAAIKRRARAQGGRCQGGFCSLKLAEILANELNISEESIWTC